MERAEGEFETIEEEASIKAPKNSRKEAEPKAGELFEVLVQSDERNVAGASEGSKVGIHPDFGRWGC